MPEHRDHPGVGCPSAALLDEIGRCGDGTEQAYTDGARDIVEEEANPIIRLVMSALSFRIRRRARRRNVTFFTETAGGRRAGRAFLERLKERTHNRDNDISLPSFRAQLKAIKQWGRQAPSDLSDISQPVLVTNGENDRMVPSQNTLDLAARLPQSELVPLYPDAGHGGIFQYHDEFVTRALGFLES